MKSALDTVAERAGIAPEFVDALGQTHRTPPEKKKALLRAMNLSVDDEAAAQATLDKLERQDWLRTLPPCVVLYADKPLQVPVNLPEGSDQPVRWVLSLEDGGELSGEMDISSSPLAGRREIDGKAHERRLLVLTGDLPWGYHRLRLEGRSGAEAPLIVTPGKCWLPGENTSATDHGESRFWGLAAQMYLLRSERNWGIGDFQDLAELVRIVRAKGGDAVGVNPLHGMFPDMPEQSSPYSPLSRYLLNSLNICVEAIPEFATSEAAQQLVGAPEFQARRTRAREAKMVAYKDVADLKMPVLQVLYQEFERDGTHERKAAFQAFKQTCDELLTVSCVYAAIRQYLTDQDLSYRDCGRWPEELKHAGSDGVAQFRQTHAPLVEYQLWLQWVADEQLAAVKQVCEGMAIGIYRDLAVGANPSGAEIWSNPGVMVSMAEVGAPPDLLNSSGQNWVLPPFHPQQMKEDGYRSFIALLRTNMRHAGGLRIDHAMALERLYWIPRGGTPRDGGYVHYPIDDLIGVIALESHRNKCLLVGEDLGTVPKGFRARMAEAQILSYKVLLLEEEEKGKGYIKGHTYQRLALSTASSHDLPTLRGWWEEVDLDLRSRLGITDEDATKKAREKRDSDREAMVSLFREEEILDGEGWPQTQGFVDAAHRFLARTDALLMMAQLEDVIEEAEQVNLPASMPDQYPSWGRRVTVPLEALAEDPRLARLAAITKDERG